MKRTRPTSPASHAAIIPSGNHFAAERKQYKHPRRYANVHLPRENGPAVIKTKPTSSLNTYKKSSCLITTLQCRTLCHSSSNPYNNPHPKLFTFKELIQAIKSLKPYKAPGHDHITTILLQQLPRKVLMKLLHIYNAILRLDYWPRPLKTEHIIMILKPGKTPTDVASYRTISLLATTANVLEKNAPNQANSRIEPPIMAPRSPIWFPEGPLNCTTNSSNHHHYHYRAQQ
jgi:hypothetical protein